MLLVREGLIAMKNLLRNYEVSIKSVLRMLCMGLAISS